MKTKIVILVISVLFFHNGYSQRIDFLDSIASLQIKRDTFYNAGLFPSQINWKKGKKSAEDNNIFFTALTLYTLQSLSDRLSPHDQAILDTMYRKAESTFQYYENRHGDITYNFYQVHPDNPFPNVNFLSKRADTKLPDDLDDTSMLYLIQPTSDSLNRAVKQKMVQEAGDTKKVKSTFTSYRSSHAYRTWFADKMKQDIDLCVNVNVLTFVFQKGIPLDTVDQQSIALIKSMVLKNEHVQHGRLVSPHYQNTSVILYHVARLLALSDNPDLNEIRSKVISDLYSQLRAAKNDMEKVIVLSSLYRLQQQVAFEIDINNLKRDMNDFYWFKANISSGKPFWIKRIFGKSNLLQYQYKSEAYYWSLVLELEKFSDFRQTGNRLTHNF